MKRIEVDSFCYGENHKRCYFLREKNGVKFCGLWMRNITGVMNPKKKSFKCNFCNASVVTIESAGGPAFIENPKVSEQGGRTLSMM